MAAVTWSGSLSYFAMAAWTAEASLLAIACPFSMARTNAAAVLGYLLRPGPGGDVPVDGEVRGGALVEVSQHLLAVLLLPRAVMYGSARNAASQAPSWSCPGIAGKPCWSVTKSTFPARSRVRPAAR